ncbi:MAG: GGDEF domain-containing protein [Solirubrobacterales bacterium]|nr:GGDEF domain-containing protein [Solirubrobacterales bacterium]
MSTDRSPEPYDTYEEAAEALLAVPDASEVAPRLLTSWLRAEERAARAEAEASIDVLTGAASRRQWERALVVEEQRCSRSGRTACVVAIDLDGLKEVNDTQGHQAGDELLVTAAGALDSATRAIDVVARVGGDEFTVLAVDTDLPMARALAARLGDALDKAGVQASLGLAERSPETGLSEAWAQADHRMYTTKRRRASQAMDPDAVSARTNAPSPTL